MGHGGRSAAEAGDRAFGGYVRSKKGRLHEDITEEVVRIAVEEIIGVKPARIKINSAKIPIPINADWVSMLTDRRARETISGRIDDYKYGLSVDKHLWIDGRFVAGLESKAYTENAMIKRILVDFQLLRQVWPDLLCYLVQLESQLGGDYAETAVDAVGSRSTCTLMSHFPSVPLQVITLLPGERKVDRPIHDQRYFKELKLERLEAATEKLAREIGEVVG